jgi:NADH-quinone oxidoreductase subunit L
MHLISHAFLKSLLFLGAGSVAFAVRKGGTLPELGGLARKLPVTAVTFAIASLSLAGLPLLFGLSSQFTIASEAGAFATFARSAGHSPQYFLLFILPVVITCLTAFYITRCWMLIFAGAPRNRRIYEHAREHPMLWFPIGLLTILSVFGGRLLDAQPLLESSTRESDSIVRDIQSKDDFFRGRQTFSVLRRVWEEDTSIEQIGSPVSDAQSRGSALAIFWLRWAFVSGVALGIAMYWNGYSVARRLVNYRPLGAIHEWLYRRMYFDELYDSVLVGTILAVSRLCAWFDRNVLGALLDRLTR